MIKDFGTLFECSWEVCNKVGGIYTVISSKAAVIGKKVEQYILIGPYIEKQAKPEFEELEIPHELKDIFYELSAETGIICHYGKWLIEGEPFVILLEFNSLKYRLAYLKKYFWENFQIDSLYSSWEFEEPMLWSYATGLLIDKFQKNTGKEKILAHFHEWLSGFGLLYLHKENSNVKTIFTTHATMLGRSLASRSIDIYTGLGNINPYDEARRIGILDKFTAEKASAQNADVFTTVSQITGKETKHILGRKPDVITVNGFNMDEFPTIEETSIMHIKSREKIKEYLTYHFFPYYQINLDNNLIFSTFGRPETKNKGTDIFVKALGRLNNYMKEEKIKDKTITVFFWPLQNNNGPKIELLESKNHFKHIKEFIKNNSNAIFNDILYDIMYDREIKVDSSLNKKFMLNMKRSRFSLRKQGKPLICSYNIGDEKNNDVLNLISEQGLDNSEENPVKVIYYPTELNSSDLFINLEVYEAIAGCHFTILPSYYEPWGYTPLESIALSVPTVTSNLSGFGRHVQKIEEEDEKSKGIFILERHQKTEEEVIENLFQIMKSFIKLKHSQRVQNKVNAKELSLKFDWKFLIENYVKAYFVALKK